MLIKTNFGCHEKTKIIITIRVRISGNVQTRVFLAKNTTQVRSHSTNPICYSDLIPKHFRKKVYKKLYTDFLMMIENTAKLILFIVTYPSGSGTNPQVYSVIY